MEGVQMSDYTIPTSNTVTTIDPQATKIRELQSDVNELKELVEYLQDRIKRLEEVLWLSQPVCKAKEAKL
jgi:peptidoglycan hydrolase CwlO-like protein